MIQQDFAAVFANEWVNAWNAHDLDAVMAHYSDDILFYSPFVIKLNNDPSGCITNKDDLRNYFARALQSYPALHFTLHKTLVSVNSVVLYYDSINDLVTAEFMEFDKHGKVIKVVAHYSD